MAIWTIQAAYDPEGRVWYTADSDVPGLSTSGRTIEELRERASLVIPDLLALNAHLLPADQIDGPHSLRILAFHESVMPVAA
jgi:predicted RNase H-like HicB family nuclease